MHYTKDYTNVPDAEAKAIQDTIDYLGQERFDRISVELKKAISDGATFPWVELAVSFAGVRDFPVRAWYNSLVKE